MEEYFKEIVIKKNGGQKMNSESIKKSMDYFRQQVGQALEEIEKGEKTNLFDLSKKINDGLEDRKGIPYIDKVYLYG